MLSDSEYEEIIRLLSLHQAPRKGFCSSWGRVHLRNFDGTILSMRHDGECAMTLLRSSTDGTFSVQYETNHGSCDGVNCPVKLRINVADEDFVLQNGIRAL